MALIKCLECGKEFSDKAPSCPNCGCPTEEIVNILKEKEDSENIDLEFELGISHGVTINIVGSKMEVYKRKKLLLSDDITNFVLTWFKYGKGIRTETLSVLFAHPNYKNNFQIALNSSSKSYAANKYFAEEIANRYFKKDIQDSFWSACGYGAKLFSQNPENMRLKCPKCQGENISIEIIQRGGYSNGKTELRKKVH